MSLEAKPDKLIIAIDGPAGAGKSTIARLVAKRMNFIYIDTGAIYRALTLKALRKGIDISCKAKLIQLAKNTKIDLENNPDGSIKILLDNQDVSTDIRRQEVSRFVSDVAKLEGVRKQMLRLQRKFGLRRSCVLDGRDIGTVVFPNADKKFFLDARFKERVKRRYKELRASQRAVPCLPISQRVMVRLPIAAAIGKATSRQKVTLREVENNLKSRDTIDSSRKCAPLKKADDALYLDTTKMTIEEVVERILKEIYR